MKEQKSQMERKTQVKEEQSVLSGELKKKTTTKKYNKICEEEECWAYRE